MLGWVKKFQYFDNGKYFLVAPNIFVYEAVKMMNDTGLREAELAWYFSSASLWISLKHSLGIDEFSVYQT